MRKKQSKIGYELFSARLGFKTSNSKNFVALVLQTKVDSTLNLKMHRANMFRHVCVCSVSVWFAVF